MKGRTAKISRKTKETSIVLELGLDGSGQYRVKTPIPFLNHMMELFAKHGLFDLKLQARGDTHVDDHHLVEDTALVLGEAFQKGLAAKRGGRPHPFFTPPPY